ncbi:unnamed protein product [Closterium sp. NIES-54]
MLIAPEGDPDAPDIPTPRSYAEAIEGPYSSQWQSAVDAKMASWKSTGTYVDEVPPPGANIVSGMWIFRVKRPPGSPPVFKARYVARGFSQRQGVDYFQTFSPTPKMTTLRVLLHIAAQRDYELHSLDFSTAFLQGSLHEEIWLRRPPGFTGSFPPGTQWNLRRPVYGLCQAPREWHDTLRTTLAALGFAPSTADPSLFLRTDTSLPPFYILVYVDDLVFATADTAGLAHVKSELQKRHTSTDLGELRSYLGLQITRDRAQRTITLTQSHMVQQVLQRFGFTYSSPQATPLSTRHSLSALPSDESVEPSGPFPELVGCLMLHRSQGYTFSLGSGSVSWRSTRSSSVLGSSCEAEIYAGAMAAQELRWLTYLLTDLGEPPRSPPVLYVDNKAMLALCREHRLEHRTKHISLRYFLARELQQRGQLRLAYVASQANTADVFTKALLPGDHQRFCTILAHCPSLLRVSSDRGSTADSSHGRGGPARVRGQGQESYFLLVVDDYSRYTTVFPLRSKGDVTEVLIDWIRAARLQLRESFGSDFPVLRLHSDRGREFSSARLGAFCRARGIRQTFTLPASPQKNGIAERRIGMVMDVARTSMIHAAAPHFLWPFALQYALRVPLPSPPESSLPVLADPASDALRAASPTVARLLSTVGTGASFESAAASALVAELFDFAARFCLDYAAGLVAESASVCPPSVGGECALSTDVLEDRQEEFQCFGAALPHLLAMDAEMATWKSTGTYVDEVPPPGANIVSGMWIFRVKRPPGSPPVFKARYVARGFSQREGVDYFQTFSPTPKMTTLRVLLHVAAQRDYELHSLDFSTAFLQGSLHEEIWLRRPPGFSGSFPPGTQWSLRRPVYGLRQAPREWHDTLRTTLAALGFAPSTADPSLFLRTDTSLPSFYILVYVDDLVFATADTAGLAHVKSELQKRHTCTDLGELRSYLGLQITRDRAQRTITLTQSHMVQQVLQRFGFTYSSP